MRGILEFFGLAAKRPPPSPPTVPPKHELPSGYTYLQYRKDLFNPSLSLNDILSRAEGCLPEHPKYPKAGELWKFVECRMHSHDRWNYPVNLVFSPHTNYWPFIFCGCLKLHESSREDP